MILTQCHQECQVSLRGESNAVGEQWGSFGLYRLGSQEQKLLHPQGTDAVPPHFKRNVLAALVLRPACIRQAPTSQIQVHSQNWLVLRLSLPCSQPSLFCQCLCCVSKATGSAGG